jgi:hypothetical protein
VTDWDKELAKIDKQLASISDEELLKPSPPVAPPGRGGAVPARPSAAPALSGPTAAGKPWQSWVKVLVAVGAAAGLMFWPWPAQCGTPLIGFIAATAGVAILGLWGAVGTWRHRLGLAHVASLLVTAWGLALGAREVLPRVGYAIPTSARPAQFSCELPAPAPADVPPVAPSP